MSSLTPDQVVHENEHIHKLQVSRGIIGGIGIVQVPEDHSSPDQHAFVGLGNGIIKVSPLAFLVPLLPLINLTVTLPSRCSA